MKLIIMAQTVNLFITRGIAHELKALEKDAISVTPKSDYVVIEIGDKSIMGDWK